MNTQWQCPGCRSSHSKCPTPRAGAQTSPQQNVHDEHETSRTKCIPFPIEDMHEHNSVEVSHAGPGDQERGQSNWKSKKQTGENTMEQTRIANTGSNFIHQMGVGMPFNWVAIGPQRITSDCKLAQATPVCTSCTAMPRAQTKLQKGGSGIRHLDPMLGTGHRRPSANYSRATNPIASEDRISTLQTSQLCERHNTLGSLPWGRHGPFFRNVRTPHANHRSTQCLCDPPRFPRADSTSTTSGGWRHNRIGVSATAKPRQLQPRGWRPWSLELKFGIGHHCRHHRQNPLARTCEKG